MTTAEKKEEIRNRFRRLRSDFPKDDLPRAGHEATAQVVDFLSGRPEIRALACYVSVRSELPTAPLVEACRAKGLRVAIPAWNAASGKYDFCWYDVGEELVPGPMRIPEPATHTLAPLSEIGLFIVPGLVFSRDGGRLGYGGGWYDRLLEGRSPDSLCAGYCLDLQISGDSLPAEPFDLPMDLLFTPTRTIQVLHG